MKSVAACSVFWVVILVGMEKVSAAGPVEPKEAAFTVNDLIGMSSGLNAVQEWCNNSSELWSFCTKYTFVKRTKEEFCWEKVKFVLTGDLNEMNLTEARIKIPENVFENLRDSFACNSKDKGYYFTLTNDNVKDVVLFTYPKPYPTTADPVTENTISEITPSSDTIAIVDVDNHLNWIIPLAIVAIVVAGLVIAFIIQRRAKIVVAEYPPSATKSNGDTVNGKAAYSNSSTTYYRYRMECDATDTNEIVDL